MSRSRSRERDDGTNAKDNDGAPFNPDTWFDNVKDVIKSEVAASLGSAEERITAYKVFAKGSRSKWGLSSLASEWKWTPSNSRPPFCG